MSYREVQCERCGGSGREPDETADERMEGAMMAARDDVLKWTGYVVGVVVLLGSIVGLFWLGWLAAERAMVDVPVPAAVTRMCWWWSLSLGALPLLFLVTVLAHVGNRDAVAVGILGFLGVMLWWVSIPLVLAYLLGWGCWWVAVRWARGVLGIKED